MTKSEIDLIKIKLLLALVTIAYGLMICGLKSKTDDINKILNENICVKGSDKND